jgi:hypothetical protein
MATVLITVTPSLKRFINVVFFCSQTYGCVRREIYSKHIPKDVPISVPRGEGQMMQRHFTVQITTRWSVILAVFMCVSAFIGTHSRAAYGQAEQGTITGTVMDSQGAVIVGTKVTATEVLTQTVSSTVTNSDGYYTIPYLAPGTYNITAETSGFKASTVSGVHLTVNLATTVNLTLAVGNVSTEITVQANAIQLETENSELGETFNRAPILDLPQMGRNAYALDALAPAVIPEETTANPLQAEINGGMANTANLLLDGGTQVNSSTGDPAITPPAESVGSFKLITNNFSAEYGMSGGGILTATTMAGTNVFHGSAYEYVRNTLFNANGWYRNYEGLKRSPTHNNLYGFSVGGPVRLPKVYNGKDKTFFFFNLEYNPSSSPDATTGTVPTQAMRTGDFSGLLDQNGNQIKIYDPATTTLVPGTTNTWTRQQFSYNGELNVIPPGRINDVAQKVLAYYPPPTPKAGIEGIYNNSVISPARITSKDNFFARVDQNIGKSQKTFIRIGRSSSNADTIPVTIAYPTGNNNGDPGANNTTAWTGAISDTWTLRPNLLAEFRGNFDRSFIQQTLPSVGFNTANLGLPASFTARVEKNIFPYFTMSDESSLGPSNASADSDAEGSYEGQAHLTWVKGPHTIKTGFDYLFVYFDEDRPGYPAGYFSFSRGYVQGPDPSVAGTDSGWGFASFLLGLPSGGQITKDPSLTASQKNMDGYLEDDYKVTHRLTFNLGVRYDVLTGFTDRHNQFAYFDPKTPDPVLGLPGSLKFVGVNGNSRNQVATAYDHFSPRLGFTYQFNDKTVFRGGYGLFFTTNTGGSVGGSGPQAGTNLYLGAPSPAPNTPPPGGTLDNPFVSGYLNPPNYLVGSSVSDPWWPGTLPYMQSRNFSIQRTLTGTTIVTVAYAGSRGEHLWYTLNRDAAPISALSYGAQLYSQVPNPYAGKLPGTLGASTIAFSSTLVPFPQYTGISWSRDPVGDSYYNAFTLQVQRQDTHGLFMGLSYTLSKNVDDVPERYNGRGSTIINPDDLGRTRGLAEYDRPQWLVVNYVYKLPFGPGHELLGHGFASQILGNWTLSGITTYGSGEPIIITATSSTYVPGISAVANRLHDPHLKTGQNPEHWFDTTAYANPANFTIGTGNRIEPDLRGPEYGEWDMGLHRRQEFKEGMVLELRLDALNVFNNRALGVPGGSITSGTYGQITSSGEARNAQLGGRFTF